MIVIIALIFLALLFVATIIFMLAENKEEIFKEIWEEENDRPRHKRGK